MVFFSCARTQFTIEYEVMIIILGADDMKMMKISVSKITTLLLCVTVMKRYRSKTIIDMTVIFLHSFYQKY